MKHVFLENLGIESETSNNVIAENEKRDNDEMVNYHNKCNRMYNP